MPCRRRSAPTSWQAETARARGPDRCADASLRGPSPGHLLPPAARRGEPPDVGGGPAGRGPGDGPGRAVCPIGGADHGAGEGVRAGPVPALHGCAAPAPHRTAGVPAPGPGGAAGRLRPSPGDRDPGGRGPGDAERLPSGGGGRGDGHRSRGPGPEARAPGCVGVRHGALAGGHRRGGGERRAAGPGGALPVGRPPGAAP